MSDRSEEILELRSQLEAAKARCREFFRGAEVSDGSRTSAAAWRERFIEQSELIEEIAKGAGRWEIATNALKLRCEGFIVEGVWKAGCLNLGTIETIGGVYALQAVRISPTAPTGDKDNG